MKRKPVFFYMKIMLAILLTAAFLAALYVYLVYNGYCQLNHPSRAKYPVRGIDVSHYQGDIDWNVLSQEDISFAYIKATEGSSHVDSRFEENWKSAGATSLAVGAYHFFSFDSPGENQAENYIQCLTQALTPDNGLGTEGSVQYSSPMQNTAFSMLPPAVDVEYYGDKKNSPPDPETVRTSLQNYLDLVESHFQKTPVIYSTEEVWERYLKGYFDEYPLWIRNVVRPPKKDAGWTFWQYSNRTRLTGYSGEEEYIDMNVFRGSLKEWENWKCRMIPTYPQPAASTHPVSNNVRRHRIPCGS